MEVGDVIDGRFVLEGLLQVGSTNEVWLAADGARKVALKLAAPASEDIPFARAVDCLKVEAEMLSRLDHPNVPRLVAARIDVERPYLATDFAGGITLEREIGRRAKHGHHFS